MENLKIGNPETDKKTLAAKPVTVTGYNVETKEVTNNGKKEMKDLLVLEVKHEDQEETIKLSKVKFEKNDKLVIQGLWLSKDSTGAISYQSTLGHLMRHCEVEQLEDFKEKQLVTTHNEQGFLVIKAYD